MTEKMTLLIVDDRQDNLLVLSSLVKEYFPSIVIFTSSCALEGIRIAVEQQIDGALIDIQMPGMDGIEMCRQLKADPRTAIMAIILLTAHSADSKLKAKGLEAGADDFILRPFDNVEFVARVKVMLRVKHAERDLREINEHLESLVTEKTGALRESEERFRQTSENLREWVWEVNTRGFYTYSTASVEMLGYTPEEVVGGKRFFDFFHPETGAVFKKTAIKMFMEKRPFRQVINKHVTKKGDTLWLSTSGVPVFDTDGTLRGYRGSTLNIDRRKRAEDLQKAQLRLIAYSATHTGQELLQQFLAEAENLTDSEIGFYHFVEDDQETITSQAWSKNTLKNMCTQTKGDRHYPISKAGVWVDCIRERKPVVHNDYENLPRKKGLPAGHAPVIRELVVPVIRGEKIKAVLGVGNKRANYTQADVRTIQRLADVGWETIDHKQSEAKRELLMAAVDQAAEAIFVTDMAGVIQYANPAFEQISGYSREEALGQNPRILASGKTSATMYREMWATLLRGESWHGRFINKKKDGTLYTEEATISPVRNESGVTTNFVAVKADITQSLELEEQLRQSQKIQAIGQLAGGIAHDFNNILTIILGYGHMACKRLPQENGTYKNIEKMLEAAKKAENLTRQLLAFSRRQVLEVKTVDLNLLVTDFKELLKKLLRENIQLNICLSEQPVLVQVDPTQAEQILVNLVVNARDAIGDNEGVIRIVINYSDLSAAEREALLPDSRKNFGLITVEDDGCGIPLEIKDKIFDPFFTTKEQGQGTGLGLSTVYGIVKQSGGYLFAESEPGFGTKFAVFFPEGDAVSEAARSSSTTVSHARRPKKVLVIDDEELLLAIVEESLTQNGDTVFSANDPFAGFDLWLEKKDELDLVITDVGLPGMNGIDLVRKMLAIKEDANILFISGYGELHNHGGNVDLDQIDFLQKPFTPAEILGKINAIFSTEGGEGA